MFRKVMGWIAGKGDDASASPDALLPTNGPDGNGPQGETSGRDASHGSGAPGQAGAGAEPARMDIARPDGGRSDGGRSPVFSSRAVRDAAVVTSAIETIRRYVAGEEQAEGLTRKLQSLSTEQFGFLQISIDPALTAKALDRVGEPRSAAATVLRRLLTDVSDGVRGPNETPAVSPAPAPAPAVRTEAEMSPAPAPIAPPAPPSATVGTAPLSVPVKPAPAAAVAAQHAPGPQPSRAGPLFTSLASKGRDASAGQAEMRTVPTPTPRVPGAMSLRAAPPTPVRPSAVAGPLPARPLSTPSQPVPPGVAAPVVTVPGAIRMASAPATAARVTLHSFTSKPAQPAPVVPVPPAPPPPSPVAETVEAPSLVTPVVVQTPPQASSDAPVPPPQPPVSRRPAAAVPRLPREQADKRRARLLEAIAGDL